MELLAHLLPLILYNSVQLSAGLIQKKNGTVLLIDYV